MKPIVAASLLALALQTSASAESIRVYFSPKGGCTGAIVEALGNAKRSVLVQAYSFTSKPIAEALVKASRRGVKVSVILDDSQATEQYSSATFLLHAGIQTTIDRAHAIAHNKIIIIDGSEVITGSFNFTKAAEDSNAENLLVINDPQIAAQYVTNWNKHAKHSDKYKGPGRAFFFGRK